MDHNIKRPKLAEDILKVAPRDINVVDFVESRAQEMVDLLSVIDRADLPVGEVGHGKKTVAQRLPRHMRRRAMSHNLKRLPHRLRPSGNSLTIITENGKDKTKIKPPSSRKYRRRPKNLLLEYRRREQAKVNGVWLETHIWHAKRFHMKHKQFGYNIPLTPVHRSFRACYRDSVRHSLVQDQSFLHCIEIVGRVDVIREALNNLTHSEVGPGFGYRPSLDGCFQGRTVLYEPGRYPHCVIGPVQYMWHFLPQKVEMTEQVSTLWMLAHPSISEIILAILESVLKVTKIDLDNSAPDEPKDPDNLQIHLVNKMSIPVPTYSSFDNSVTVRWLRDKLCIFNLTGPMSSVVLGRALQVPTEVDLASVDLSDWLVDHDVVDTEFVSLTILMSSILSKIGAMQSAELPPGLVIPLLLKDPRLSWKHQKSKPQFKPASFGGENLEEDLKQLRCGLKNATVFNEDLRLRCLEHKKTVGQLNDKRNEHNSDILSKSDGQLSFNVSPCIIPAILIHEYSNASSHGMTKNYLDSNYGSGFKLVIPGGWAMPFWLALQYSTAHAVGISESKNVAFESGYKHFPEFWPDSVAGKAWEETHAEAVKEKYLKKPWNRRHNFIQLRVVAPFALPWSHLLLEWNEKHFGQVERGKVDDCYYVLRNRKDLRLISQFLQNRRKLKDDGQLKRLSEENCNALIGVRITACGRGSINENAMICKPDINDKIKVSDLLREREDPSAEKLEAVTEPEMVTLETNKTDDDDEYMSISNEEEINLEDFFTEKQQKTTAVRKAQRMRKKLRRNAAKSVNCQPVEPGHPKKTIMSNNGPVIDSCSRLIMGFVQQGGISFRCARGVGLGYCSLVALIELIENFNDHNQKPFVLFRNKTSKFYRSAFVELK